MTAVATARVVVDNPRDAWRNRQLDADPLSELDNDTLLDLGDLLDAAGVAAMEQALVEVWAETGYQVVFEPVARRRRPRAATYRAVWDRAAGRICPYALIDSVNPPDSPLPGEVPVTAHIGDHIHTITNPTVDLEVDAVAPQGADSTWLRVHGPDGEPQYVSAEDTELHGRHRAPEPPPGTIAGTLATVAP